MSSAQNKFAPANFVCLSLIIFPLTVSILVLILWLANELARCSATLCFNIDLTALVPDTSAVISSVVEDLKAHQQADDQLLMTKLAEANARLASIEQTLEQFKALLLNKN